MNDVPRTVFFGTPAFAVPMLEVLTAVSDVVAVVTQPNRPSGRHHKPRPTPVRQYADDHRLRCMVPEKINAAFVQSLRDINPDVAVLAAYGKILPEELLAVPRKGFVNVHPSLLPRHRGPSPVAEALLAGDRETGVTLMVLDEEMDHGPVLAQDVVPIEPHEYRAVLEQRLSRIGAELLRKNLLPYLIGEIIPRPQDHARATYTKMLRRRNGLIDWRKSADEIERLIRGLNPWPGTHTTFQGAEMKILDGRAAPRHRTHHGHTGHVIAFNVQPAVVCGTGLLVLTRVQLPGGRPTEGAAFARGHPDVIGSTLGS